jgi:hypothetical protein
MSDSQKCIVDELFGFQHNYPFCVKPSDKMVDTSTFNRGGLTSLDNTAKVFGGMFNYVNYLVSDANKGTAEQCLYNNKGVVGNKYVLKTNIECTPVDSLGNIITPAGETPYMHKYINNITDGSSFLTGGQSNSQLTGVVPSAFHSLNNVATNVIDLVSSFTGSTKPYCMKASVKCHIIDYNMYGVRGTRNYSGASPSVYFSIDDLKRIKAENLSSGAITIPTIQTPPPPSTSTTTTGSSPTTENYDNNEATISDNIIKQNMDKIQNFSDMDKIQNFSDMDKMLESLNIDKVLKFEDELLVKMFYVGFSIFLILILLKLVFKKK